MPARVSEAIVLRTYPLKESDLIVSFFTRDQGKLRGVAKRARRPKSGFGSGLERLSHVKMFYFERETRELASLDQCELIHSQFAMGSDFAVSVGLDYMAEVSDQLLPSHEVNERFFRLLVAVLDHLRTAGEAGLWRAVTYFSFWAIRLAGFLPALHVCLSCGAWLDDPDSPQRAFFMRDEPGLRCNLCRRSSSEEMTVASRTLAREMLTAPVGAIGEGAWGRDRAKDLRHMLEQRIEDAIERRLLTLPVLEAC